MKTRQSSDEKLSNCMPCYIVAFAYSQSKYVYHNKLPLHEELETLETRSNRNFKL